MWVWSSDEKRIINIDLYHEIKIIKREIPWKGQLRILVGVVAVAYMGQEEVETPFFSQTIPANDRETLHEALKRARAVYRGIVDSLKPVKLPALL